MVLSLLLIFTRTCVHVLDVIHVHTYILSNKKYINISAPVVVAWAARPWCRPPRHSPGSPLLLWTTPAPAAGHCLCGVGRIQMMMGEYRQTSIDKQASTNRESLPKKKHEHSDTKRESSAKAMPSRLHVLVFCRFECHQRAPYVLVV